MMHILSNKEAEVQGNTSYCV